VLVWEAAMEPAAGLPGSWAVLGILSWSPEVIAMAEAEPVTPAQARPVNVGAPCRDRRGQRGRHRRGIRCGVRPGVAVVIADMTATTFCGSVGVRMLVLAGRHHRHGLAAGAAVAHVLRGMKIQGVHAVLPIYCSLDEALSGPAVTLSGTQGPLFMHGYHRRTSGGFGQAFQAAARPHALGPWPGRCLPAGGGVGQAAIRMKGRT
jgi:hypothetical protein